MPVALTDSRLERPRKDDHELGTVDVGDVRLIDPSVVQDIQAMSRRLGPTDSGRIRRLPKIHMAKEGASAPRSHREEAGTSSTHRGVHAEGLKGDARRNRWNCENRRKA